MGLGYIAAAVALAPLAGAILVKNRNYLSKGFFGVTMGYTPERINSAGGLEGRTLGMKTTWDSWTKVLPAFDETPLVSLAKQHGWVSKEVAKKIGWLGPTTMAANAFFVYQGYKEGGFSGAKDALVLNFGVEAALNKFAYGVGNAINLKTGSFINSGARIAGHGLHMGLGSMIFRGAGASIGGSIGQSLGNATGIPFMGTFGAYMGAHTGAAPIRAIVNNPILFAGAAVAAAGAGLTYGMYSFAKEGMAYAQSRRGINTDGDIAAFMSQGAVTMRERSVQAIAKSHLNARSALGMEASFLHSPYKNYNSRYR